MSPRLRELAKQYLMSSVEIFSSLLRQATFISRSTVLRPLGTLIAILAAALIAGIELKAPSWIGATLIIFIGVTVALYLGAYIFCLRYDRDALRTERYSLEKIAIEKGIVGDNLVGALNLGGRRQVILPPGEAAEKQEK